MNDSSSIFLQDPDDLALENAYRSLPGTGEIIVNTNLTRLSSCLESIERMGFAGMEISAFGLPGAKITIRGYKGKQGTCYNTGRLARYLGAASAALDDDHHLLLAGDELPVCEKTATFYSLPSYRNLVHCSDANPALIEKLKTDPDLFEGDEIESTQEKLFSIVKGKRDHGDFTGLFYPGPFKLLVLENGTILHRGRVNSVPERFAKKLIMRDGLFRYDEKEAGPDESFTELYQAEGPRCLLKKTQGKIIHDHDHLTNFSALSQITRDFSERLIRLIESRRDYFMLTGSNREDTYGCCPSDDVTMADHLVWSGILDASRENASQDACPVALYAFRNEISIEGGDIQFSQNPELRQEVLSRLKKTHRSIHKILIRWMLLTFVAITILLALNRISGSSSSLKDHGMFTQLELSRPNSTAVVLFHYNQRCDQCLAMEKYTREVLSDKFARMQQSKQIQFRRVIMDLPGNRNLIERLGLVTSSLVIIHFEGMEEESIRVLDRSWELYNDEVAFKKMLSEKLHQMTEKNNE